MAHEWITPGAPVAVVTRHYGEIDSVRLDTVERLTATQVVLAGGERFRRSNLRKVGHGNPYRWVRVLPVDDPDVVAARARKIHDELMRRIEHGQQLLKPERDLRTIDAILHRLESIAAAVAAAQQQIKKIRGD